MIDQRPILSCAASPFVSSTFTTDTGDFSGDAGALFAAPALLFSSTIWPSESRGLRFQPVFSPRANSNLGKMCASVLSTILSKGRRSLGENRR